MKEDWANNMHCVQAHAFNNMMESLETTVSDYLLKFSHDIISFRMFDRLIDYWNSCKLDWHLERGLRLNIDGTPGQGSSQRGVTAQLYKTMNKYQKQQFTMDAKMGVYCVSCFKPGSLTAHMGSTGA